MAEESEDDIMMAMEFVYRLWLESDEYDKPMDEETAALDLETFRANGWNVPQSLTPERMTDIWNKFANGRIIDNE